MANSECISNAAGDQVAKAERELFGPLGELASLIELYKGSPDLESWSCLAVSAMERLSDRFDQYHHLVVRYGRPSLAEVTHAA